LLIDARRLLDHPGSIPRLGFALSNTAVTELRFGVDSVWRALSSFSCRLLPLARPRLPPCADAVPQRREIAGLPEVRATARPATAGGASAQPPSRMFQ
jgi:hypothetical protein